MSFIAKLYHAKTGELLNFNNYNLEFLYDHKEEFVFKCLFCDCEMNIIKRHLNNGGRTIYFAPVKSHNDGCIESFYNFEKPSKINYSMFDKPKENTEVNTDIPAVINDVSALSHLYTAEIDNCNKDKLKQSNDNSKKVYRITDCSKAVYLIENHDINSSYIDVAKGRNKDIKPLSKLLITKSNFENYKNERANLDGIRIIKDPRKFLPFSRGIINDNLSFYVKEKLPEGCIDEPIIFKLKFYDFESKEKFAKIFFGKNELTMFVIGNWKKVNDGSNNTIYESYITDACYRFVKL